MRLGKSSWPSIPGPISPRSSSSSSSPTTIAHCGLPIETCWNSHSRPPALSVPRPSSPPEGKSLEAGRGPAHLDRAGQLAGDRRRDRPGDGADREGVLVGPAVPAQVEDRLARPVAGQLGLGAVGVEDPQLGDELGVLAAREQQHPVGADPEVRVAEPLDPLRVQLPGKVLRLDDQVVVAQRLPLLESHRREPSSPTGRKPYMAGNGPSTSFAISARPRRRAAGAVDRVEVGDLAHPGELAAGVVARALLHRLEVAGEQLVEAERLAGGARRARAASARRTSSSAPAATIASVRASIRS